MSKPNDLKLLYDILYRSHFLILPTEFEAFGIVFCEASAYGMPSIAANVGGVSQPIRESKNGFLLSPNATAEEYAEKIKLAFSDKETYLKLRRSSRNEYEKRLNWRIWGKKMDKILDKTIKEYSNNKEKHTHEEFYLPVYVINMRNRVERRSHIEKQFQGKPEFKLTWIEAIEHPIGAVGLWKSMVKVVETAIINDDDIIIICEDDHTFTSAYSKEYFFANIIAANNQESELLSGGIGGFGTAVPVDSNRYWIDWFWCTQFIVVFKPLFQKILDFYKFNCLNEIAFVHFHYQINYTSAFATSEIVPQIFLIIYFETCCFLVPKRTFVHSVAKMFFRWANSLFFKIIFYG